MIKVKVLCYFFRQSVYLLLPLFIKNIFDAKCSRFTTKNPNKIVYYLVFLSIVFAFIFQTPLISDYILLN